MSNQSCVSGVCGTGTGNFPQPGDPDNNSILSAVSAFGGIDVTWTYPEVNPQAVAHTLLYRGTSSEFDGAVQIAVVAGNFFYDKSTTATEVEFYYWIRHVSINGTYAEVIGPARAVARPPLSAMIEALTAKIDSGFLAQELKKEIDQIRLNKLGLTQEILDRAATDQALGAAFNEVEAHSEQTRAILQQEVLARTKADSALVTQVNTVFAEMESRVAAVQRVSEALVEEARVKASTLEQVQATLFGDNVSGEVGLTAQIEQLNETTIKLGAQYTAKVNVNGLIGGFGVYNDGTTVEAGFDVDRFWLGRTGASKRKPFIVENGEVFIDQAAINSLVFTKLRDEAGKVMIQDGKIKADFLDLNLAQVSGALQSKNFVSGQRGFRLDVATNTFENNGGGADGRMTQTNQAIKVFDESGNKRVQLGNLKA